MEIDFLRHFDFSKEQLSILQSTYGNTLLPLQERVIREGKLFEGGRLLIRAPTSSGKTFLAEILFLYHVTNGKNAVLLIPTKALANQRYLQLQRRYEKIGYHIVLSTRDHAYNDRDILEGRFHMAVVIYEKFQSLLMMDDSFLSSLGACIVDEIHYLFDPERGPDLEILLTRLREKDQLQILGLSAMVSDPDVGTWLGAQTLADSERPVELRQGVLCHNRFTYREFNSGAQGEEILPLPELNDEGEAMLEAARYFASKGEMTILFWPRRDLCYTAARKLAERF